MDKLKVIFMGTPDFAVPSLAALIDKTEILCVVTQPDRPKGRGHKLLPPPVKVFAEENNLRVIQPVKVKAPEVVAQLAELKPDLIVVVAFGQILSQAILDIPRLGCINVHASLLPKYRGAAPIEWAMINGEQVTGITTMQMNAGLDTGDMLLKSEVKIPDDMILPELRERLMTVGADLLLKTLYELQNGGLQAVKQDDSLSTYAPLLKKDTGLIDWNKSAREIHNLVRGLYGSARAGKYKIWRTRLAEENLSPAEIKIVGQRFFVGTGDGSLEILELQAPNAKKLAASDFLRGNKVGDDFWTNE
ncbi:MAG: methionyl-tRNA formyltransferase [Selenomonadaceae bacterium]|nr:methionyl-tRNA formyltransferase [Selenomonadaceae bacterium]MBQ6759731.1 methionyl-tRNA formyltransferase [Selenomonadaceae bacterium]MBR0102124.1 methionyl-tRNA formyltransferase [Selenomonadaceae bacterium]